MIINIRGTHGSGKSYIIKWLLEKYKAKPESLTAKGQPANYIMTIPKCGVVYVVGRYTTACGGCDGIQPYSEIWPRVEKFADLGHVLFEGALVSSSYGNIGRASEVYGNDFVFAFLDTPLEICLKRIKQRRKARGDFRPLNPKNTKGKYDSIQKSILKIRGEFNRRVAILNFESATSQVLKLLQQEGKIYA